MTLVGQPYLNETAKHVGFRPGLQRRPIREADEHMIAVIEQVVVNTAGLTSICLAPRCVLRGDGAR